MRASTAARFGSPAESPIILGLKNLPDKLEV